MTLLQVFTEKVADVIADVEVGVKKSKGKSWTTTFSFAQGKDGKNQPDGKEHSIYDSKHSISQPVDIKHSVLGHI